jgi:hypothetical protein
VFSRSYLKGTIPVSLDSKVDVILTVINIILGNIIVLVILSLCIDTDDSFYPTKINRKPLFVAVTRSNPASEMLV